MKKIINKEKSRFENILYNLDTLEMYSNSVQKWIKHIKKEIKVLKRSRGNSSYALKVKRKSRGE